MIESKSCSRTPPSTVSANTIVTARLTTETSGRGFVDVTAEIAKFVRDAGAREGAVTLFIRHTSASLTIQENADPTVLADLTTALDRLAPENAGWRHDTEGPDDMPAHIRTGICSELAARMVLICAGMSSGPSVSWRHPAFSGASRSSAVIRSSSTVGSAFSWIVSDAEVWRMNSVTTPSRAPASFANFATSAVRSVKPRPEVSTVKSDVTRVSALTVDSAERDSFGEVMKYLSMRRPGAR